MIDPSRESELNHALELLHLAFRAVVAKPDRLLGRRGLSRVHHRVLYAVGRYPDVSVSRLQQMLGVSKQALNGPLRALVGKRLIAVRAAHEDRRVKRLLLTAKGEALEATLSGDQRRRFTAVFDVLGRDKEAVWREVTRLLADRRFDGDEDARRGRSPRRRAARRA